MTYTPNNYTNGMTDYVVKINQDFGGIAGFLNALLQDMEGVKQGMSAGGDLDFRLSAVNLLVNGGFDYWQRGDTERPDFWKVENENPGHTVEKEAAIISLSEYSAKTFDKGQLTQEMDDNTRLALSGTSSVSLVANVYASDSNTARIGIYNGTTHMWSGYHSGIAGWEKLRVSWTQGFATLPPELKFVLDCNKNNEICYWSGVCVIRGNPSTAPFYIPHNKHYERLLVLAEIEHGKASVRGVGELVAADRVLEQRQSFVAPKNVVPGVVITSSHPGFVLTAEDITEFGFALKVVETGGASGTNGFNLTGIEWTSEVP